MAAAKLIVDLAADKKQLADVEKQVVAARTQVSELQASVTKGNADLQAAIVQHGRTRSEAASFDLVAAQRCA